MTRILRLKSYYWVILIFLSLSVFFLLSFPSWSAAWVEVHEGGPQKRSGCPDSAAVGALQLREDEHVARSVSCVYTDVHIPLSSVQSQLAAAAIALNQCGFESPRQVTPKSLKMPLSVPVWPSGTSRVEERSCFCNSLRLKGGKKETWTESISYFYSWKRVWHWTFAIYLYNIRW